jgi:redox-sensing transcriptional repressor
MRPQEEDKTASQIPEVVVLRLPIYARALAVLARESREVVSSNELAARLQVTPAQIRKDLSYFGRFGKQGRGYNVINLLSQIRRILGLDRQWSMALVGVGRLGRALLHYGTFAAEGFKLVAAFDSDRRQIGTQIDGVVIQSTEELSSIIREREVNICIIAVPAPRAQEVIDMIVQCGVKAILNYAPIACRVPSGVWVRDIDPICALQSMTFHLKAPHID